MALPPFHPLIAICQRARLHVCYSVKVSRNRMLVSIRDLYKSYRRGGGFSRASISALRGVDFYIDRGDRVAVVGESGSGKSTLGKCIAGWEQPDGGEIRFAPSVSTQLIPQNPGESLNPRLTVREIVEEPYRIRRENVRAPREGASRWMHETGLEPGTEARTDLGRRKRRPGGRMS